MFKSITRDDFCGAPYIYNVQLYKTSDISKGCGVIYTLVIAEYVAGLSITIFIL